MIRLGSSRPFTEQYKVLVVMRFALLCVFSIVFTWMTAVRASGSGVTDHVKLGDAASEASHQFAGSGNTTRQHFPNVKAGAFTESIDARAIGVSAQASCDVAISRNAPLTIQIREMRPNERWGESFGYQVFINGKLRFQQGPSITDMGLGAYRSVFIEVNDPAVTSLDRAHLTIQSIAGDCFISDIWAYANLDDYVRNEGLDYPMSVIPLLGGRVDDDATINSRLDDLAGMVTNDYVKKGFFCSIDLLNLPDSLVFSSARRLLNIARQRNVPIQIKYVIDWGGTPNNVSVPGQSGKKFGDVEFQQICWSPEDQYADPGVAALMGDSDLHWGLSVPSSITVPLMTFNHPVLNAYYETKLLAAYQNISQQVSLLKSEGRNNLLLPFTTANETFLCARTDNVGQNQYMLDDSLWKLNNNGQERIHCYADFNPYAVQKAASEGVTLNPKDGLSPSEKEWIQDYKTNHNKDIAGWIYASLAREDIEVRGSTLTYPEEMRRHTIWTEPWPNKMFPLDLDTRPNMETGMVPNANPGCEYYREDQLKHLRKQREYGRIADPNFETQGMSTSKWPTVIRQQYAMGSDHVTPYNYGWSNPSTFVNAHNLFANNIPWSIDGVGSNSVAPSPAVVSVNSATQRIGQDFRAGAANLMLNCVRLQVDKVGDTSSIDLTVKIYESAARDNLLTMRALSSAEINDGFQWTQVFLPFIELSEGRKYYLQLTQSGPVSANNHYAFRANTGDYYANGAFWLNEVANNNLDLVFETGVDLEKERSRSVIVSWRREVDDTRNELLGESGGNAWFNENIAAAAELASAGRYRAAYQCLLKADVQRYPVPYLVLGNADGALRPFPFSVNFGANSGQRGRVDVIAYDATARTLDLRYYTYEAGQAIFKLPKAFMSQEVFVDRAVVPASVQRLDTEMQFKPTLAANTYHTLSIHPAALVCEDFFSAASVPNNWVLQPGATLEYALLHTLSTASAGPIGIRTKASYAVPAAGLVLEYDFYPISMSDQSAAVATTDANGQPIDHFAFMLTKAAGGKIAAYTKHGGVWAQRSGLQEQSLKVGQWYHARLTVKPSSVSMRVSEQDIGGRIVFDSGPLACDLLQKAGFSLFDLGSSGANAETKWDNFIIYRLDGPQSGSCLRSNWKSYP